MISTTRFNVLGLIVIFSIAGFVFGARSQAQSPSSAVHRVTEQHQITITVNGHYPCNEDEILEGRGDYITPGVWNRYICKPGDSLNSRGR
jgi:hypothetical protein